MTDGPAKTEGADAPAGAPSARALGAMESAVQRVRASRQPGVTEQPRVSDQPSVIEPPTPPDPYRPPAPAVGRTVSWTDRWATGDRDRWLGIAVVVLAVMVVGAAIALIVSLAGSGTHVASPPATSATTTSPSAHHHSGHQPGPTTTGSTTTTSIVATPGGPPVISALSPSTGAAGQSITITGANFMSSDGQIVASFNGQVAATSCPAQNTCTVTVPPSSGGASAQVIVTTASGASNAVPFSYG